jgi:Outer membrane protein beta-barrel domain
MVEKAVLRLPLPSWMVLCLGALAVPALAQAQVVNDDPYITPYGPYAGIGWGHFDLNLDNLEDVDTAVNSIVHSGDDAWKVNVGYRFSPYFALEGDYMNFGNSEDSFTGTGSSGSYRLHMSGFAPFGMATLPIGPAEVFAKAGWLFYDANLRVNLNAPGSEVLESSHSRSDFIWGGGVGVTLARHVNLNVESDVVRVENAHNSNVLWLSPVWRF